MAKRPGDFTETTKRIIAQRVNGFCSFEGCNRVTFIAHSDPEKVTSLGEAAHITAASSGGPRYDPDMSEEERKSASNGIWMCREHAREIDVDLSLFPTELLRRWKSQREEEVARSRKFFLRAGTPHWNVPSHNDFFTGRKDLLASLEDRLTEKRSVEITQTIVGLGGIGKTQLAVELCHRNREHYPFGVFWADGSSSDSLKTSYASFAVDLGWIDSFASVEKGAEVWLRQTRSTAGWLLVIDNADNPNSVDDLVPRAAKGHLLITTRNHSPGWGGNPLTVEVLAAESAVNFLLNRSRRSESERQSCEQLAKELGYLPLALEQAAAYLAQNRAIRAVDYLDGFRERKIAFLEDERSDRPLKGDYDQTVGTTWEISFQELPVAAQEALQAMAFLASQRIPLSFLQQSGLGPALDELDLSNRFVIQREAVKPLSDYSLIQVSEDAASLSIHRLVQETIQYRIEIKQDNGQGQESRFLKILERVQKALARVFPTSDGPESWGQGAIWLPHVISGFHLYKKRRFKPSVIVLDLWKWAANQAAAAGKVSTALELDSEIVQFRRTEIGKETLLAEHNRAVSLHEAGHHRQSYSILSRTLHECRESMPIDHELTLRISTSLAEVLISLEDPSASMRLIVDIGPAVKQLFGPDHPETLRLMSNLAESFRCLGLLEQAKELHKLTLGRRRLVLRPNDPAILVSLNNLGVVYRQLGESRAALEMLEEALNCSIHILGEDHPRTLTTLNNLGVAYSQNGKKRIAIETLQKAYRGRHSVLGPDHPQTLQSFDSLESIRK